MRWSLWCLLLGGLLQYTPNATNSHNKGGKSTDKYSNWRSSSSSGGGNMWCGGFNVIHDHGLSGFSSADGHLGNGVLPYCCCDCYYCCCCCYFITVTVSAAAAAAAFAIAVAIAVAPVAGAAAATTATATSATTLQRAPLPHVQHVI